MRRCLVWHCVVRCNRDWSVSVWNKDLFSLVLQSEAGFLSVKYIIGWFVLVLMWGLVWCDSDRFVLVWDKSFPGSVKHGEAGFGFVRCITDWSVSVWNNNFQGGFLFGLV